MEKLSPTLLPKQSTRKYIVALQDTYKILQAYCYLHTQALQAPGYNRSTSLSPFFNLIVGFTIKLQVSLDEYGCFLMIPKGPINSQQSMVVKIVMEMITFL